MGLAHHQGYVYDRKKKGDKAAKEEQAKAWLRAKCEQNGWPVDKAWL